MTDVELTNISVPGIGTIQMKKSPHSGSPQSTDRSFLECGLPDKSLFFRVKIVDPEAEG